ncbi:MULTISPECIES: cation:dicarboxylate symporter family transporter [unclassified Streptomyces]|uniref:cation:dicarboxylate symporter family transporter n=1 Tax=unclassified Streptomyces TaxID=2593676 RepID=UPI0022B6FE9E|nr:MULTISPECIES: cation:dicarboxylase symporter family transporter [unclassified Streptomyces]MCZ7414360.1 cation:dicarboxylase symporter family transporter [Streptomyces sp. WMMC897]MCZ7431315.1 cation:dicarboxylase symporter family transporter [Streptomyces sp. WMMC1477]
MGTATGGRRPWHRTLTLWVVIGLAAGAAFGALAPEYAVRTRFLADAFVSLMTMIIAPVIFTTVVSGIVAVGGGRRLGRLSLKALLYFEVATTLALLLGLLAGNLLLLLPVGRVDDAQVRESDVAPLERVAADSADGTLSLDWIVPETFTAAFTSGNALHVLLVAALFGTALMMSGERGKPVLDLIDRLGHIFFRAVRLLVAGAPLAAFGGAAFTVSRFGLVPLRSLASLVLVFYLACAFVVFAGLGLLARLNGFSLLLLIRYLRSELLVLLGTSSSESVFPQVLRKLELAGAPRAVSAPVLAGGYSLHLMGTCVYLTTAAVYLAAAAGEPLSLGEQLLFLALALVTSKSAVGVTGSGLVTLVATISIAHSVPLAAVALVIGIDRLMSEARAFTNLLSNSVAAVVITRWVGRLDRRRLHQVLTAPRPADHRRPEDDPAVVQINISD